MTQSNRSLNLGLRAAVAALALLAVFTGLGRTANAATCHAYAPPNYFGTWTQVGAHIGAAHYSITVTPVGNTVVASEVRYFDVNGHMRIQPFHGRIEIDTGDSYGTIQIRCKGIPLGSAVKIDIN